LPGEREEERRPTGLGLQGGKREKIKRESGLGPIRKRERKIIAFKCI
jgi:hypothetical protein